MATKRDGERYLGVELHVPLSQDGQVAAYVWPVRIVVIRGVARGGPTIGVDVGNEDVLRFDCHDAQGHWHGGGYDRSGHPTNSQRAFPESVRSVAQQITWSLQQIRERGQELLEEAEHGSAAQMVDPSLLQAGIEAIRDHLDKTGDLRSKAVEEKLIPV